MVHPPRPRCAEVLVRILLDVSSGNARRATQSNPQSQPTGARSCTVTSKRFPPLHFLVQGLQDCSAASDAPYRGCLPILAPPIIQVMMLGTLSWTHCAKACAGLRSRPCRERPPRASICRHATAQTARCSLCRIWPLAGACGKLAGVASTIGRYHNWHCKT